MGKNKNKNKNVEMGNVENKGNEDVINQEQTLFPGYEYSGVGVEPEEPVTQEEERDEEVEYNGRSLFDDETKDKQEECTEKETNSIEQSSQDDVKSDEEVKYDQEEDEDVSSEPANPILQEFGQFVEYDKFILNIGGKEKEVTLYHNEVIKTFYLTDKTFMTANEILDLVDKFLADVVENGCYLYIDLSFIYNQARSKYKIKITNPKLINALNLYLQSKTEETRSTVERIMKTLIGDIQ